MIGLCHTAPLPVLVFACAITVLVAVAYFIRPFLLLQVAAISAFTSLPRSPLPEVDLLKRMETMTYRPPITVARNERIAKIYLHWCQHICNRENTCPRGACTRMYTTTRMCACACVYVWTVCNCLLRGNIAAHPFCIIVTASSWSS
jgi:hypothetical protein